MEKPNGYDGATPKEAGAGFLVLPEGGYVLVIKTAEEKQSSKGNEMIVLGLDIAQGEYTGTYAERTAKDTNGNDWYLKYYQLTEGDHVEYVKGLLSAVERSNPGYTFFGTGKGNVNTLLGKTVAGLILNEPGLKDPSKSFPKVQYLRSVDKVGEIKIPANRKAKAAPASNKGAWGEDNPPAHNDTDNRTLGEDELPF